MKNKAFSLSMLSLLSTISGCTLYANEPESALLLSNDSEARIEVMHIVAQSLGQENIALANDVFQTSSKLIISPKPLTSPTGVPVYGSSNHPAIIFELIKLNKQCLLKRIDTLDSWSLKTKACVDKK